MTRIIFVLLALAAVAVAQVPQVSVPQGALTAASTVCAPTACVQVVLEGSEYSALGIQVSGTWSATVVFEGTIDGANWGPLQSVPGVTSTTANGQWTSSIAGLYAARVRVSAYTSGTVNVVLRPSLGTISFGLLGTSATTLTQAVNQGAEISEHGARWSVVSTPAVSTQASASKAAGGAGVRHVADCINFSGGSTTAPALTKLTVDLRDGATGAGTILWSSTVVVSAATGQNVLPFTACGLGLIGSANTAMTLEFSALLTNLFENATLSGFDVQ